MRGPAIFQRSFLVFACVAALPAHAVRTAVFPSETRARTAIWLDQQRILSTEAATEKSRAIWVHGGDSASTAWANGPGLRSKIERAEKGPLPEARSVRDYLEHLPDATMTWYAGTNLGYGLLGFLDSLKQQPWVVLSTALAGARMSPFPATPDEDPLRYMTEIDEPERVKLVTFSLGTNDVCDGLDPTTDLAAFRERIRALPRKFPKALIVPIKIIPVQQIHATIFKALGELPESPGKQRVIEYCARMWDGVCHEATIPGSTRIEAIDQQISRVYQEEIGAIFDTFAPLISQLGILDLVSSDCFHPSSAAEKLIVPAIRDFISTHQKF